MKATIVPSTEPDGSVTIKITPGGETDAKLLGGSSIHEVTYHYLQAEGEKGHGIEVSLQFRSPKATAN